MAGTAQPQELEPAPVEIVPGTDLKSRLTAQLRSSKAPGEILKVSQVTANHFRVNYLAPTTIQGDATVMKTYRVSKSRFLRVDVLEGELVITDQTRN